ncbi:MAG: sulfur carrier protein ThiS [Akkermansiaceae bacterium]|nr:sulfur carrier protein ThiS [Akkermansiaceae bacterium]MCF7731149.1 sulfur carrier protein ThiS [Akkermansiaceae bacterium]
MIITLNGTPHEIPAPVTLAALLETLGLAGRPVVVELNEVAVLPRDYSTTTVPADARLEVVTLAAGG